MSFQNIVDMSRSGTLINRIAACAASEPAYLESVPPNVWAGQNAMKICAKSADWAAAWEYAENTKTANQNPDTGMRSDVITDQMILSVVQAVLTP